MVNQALTDQDYRALADFRYRVRRFLHFSEEAARRESLEPHQHQMLLAIRALDAGGGPTVGKLAEYLLIRHHSAVGLVDRLAGRGLAKRVRTGPDRRQVRVRLTPEGTRRLARLSRAHRQELSHSGPELVSALGRLLRQLRAQNRDRKKKKLEGHVSTTKRSRPEHT